MVHFHRIGARGLLCQFCKQPVQIRNRLALILMDFQHTKHTHHVDVITLALVLRVQCHAIIQKFIVLVEHFKLICRTCRNQSNGTIPPELILATVSCLRTFQIRKQTVGKYRNVGFLFYVPHRIVTVGFRQILQVQNLYLVPGM